MKKLTLNADTLKVESFSIPEAALPGGTVMANSYVTIDPVNAACSEPRSQYCVETDYYWNTCGNSCVNMCFPTGNDPSCAC